MHSDKILRHIEVFLRILISLITSEYLRIIRILSECILINSEVNSDNSVLF